MNIFFINAVLLQAMPSAAPESIELRTTKTLPEALKNGFYE
jgi:hypothetical protein